MQAFGHNWLKSRGGCCAPSGGEGELGPQHNVAWASLC